MTIILASHLSLTKACANNFGSVVCLQVVCVGASASHLGCKELFLGKVALLAGGAHEKCMEVPTGIGLVTFGR